MISMFNHQQTRGIRIDNFRPLFIFIFGSLRLCRMCDHVHDKIIARQISQSVNPSTTPYARAPPYQPCPHPFIHRVITRRRSSLKRSHCTHSRGGSARPTAFPRLLYAAIPELPLLGGQLRRRQRQESPRLGGVVETISKAGAKSLYSGIDGGSPELASKQRWVDSVGQGTNSSFRRQFDA